MPLRSCECLHRHEALQLQGAVFFLILREKKWTKEWKRSTQHNTQTPAAMTAASEADATGTRPTTTRALQQPPSRPVLLPSYPESRINQQLTTTNYLSISIQILLCGTDCKRFRPHRCRLSLSWQSRRGLKNLDNENRRRLCRRHRRHHHQRWLIKVPPAL